MKIFRALIRPRVNTAGRAGNLRNQNEMRKILLHAREGDRKESDSSELTALENVL